MSGLLLGSVDELDNDELWSFGGSLDGVVTRGRAVDPDLSQGDTDGPRR